MTFKQIPNFPKYEITNNGVIRNIRTQKILTLSKDERGYIAVMLYKDKKKCRKRIAKLVYETFRNECTQTIDHKDQNKENNYIHNLRCVSYSENARNRSDYSNKTNKYNLTDKLKKEILIKYRTGELTSYGINRIYGVQSNYFFSVLSRGTWDKLFKND
jgi:hypothetical protein